MRNLSTAMESRPCSPQLEKAHEHQWRPNTAKINNLKNKENWNNGIRQKNYKGKHRTYFYQRFWVETFIFLQAEISGKKKKYPYWLQFSSVTKLCPTLCDPMNHSTPGLPVHHQLPEFTQIHIHRVSDAIQPSHALSSPSPPVPNPSQHHSPFQWVNSSHEVAKVLEFQL